MLIPRHVQFHTLHSYSASLLNRDDTGLAKVLPFGGKMRTRLSSQSRKYSFRNADDDHSLSNIPGVISDVRSRDIVDRMVMAPLRRDPSFNTEVLDVVGKAFNKGVYGASGETISGRQPLLMGLPEVEYLVDKAREICQSTDEPEVAEATANALFNGNRGEGANFRAFLGASRLAIGISNALYGRMITSDPAANIDAAVYVAHSFTVHEEEKENDYFSVVDDLKEENEGGAAHIGNSELTSGLFYGYVVVNIPMLVSNIEGCKENEWLSVDRDIAARVVEYLSHLIATISPGAKQGSTAPFSYADMLLVEAGSRQPRSLANAFRVPVTPTLSAANKAMAKYLSRFDAVYGTKEARRLVSLEEHPMPGASDIDMDGAGEWLAEIIRAGNAE